MNEILTRQHKHLIWQDELGEPFLLLKYAEVFEYSETVLGLHCWSRILLAVMRLKGLISFEMATADPLHILRVDRCHLPLLISLGAFKKRPDVDGSWVKEKEKLLAHQIQIYRSTLGRIEGKNLWEEINERKKVGLKQWLAKGHDLN